MLTDLRDISGPAILSAIWNHYMATTRETLSHRDFIKISVLLIAQVLSNF